MDKQLLSEFKEPGSKYRGAPFWAWNGKLDPEELRRQVRIMHRMGLGGFFMHSRVGLDTAYLSDEWFECVNACIDEAEKLDMQPWLYDEDRWPSGAAGGLVTKNPAYQHRSLAMEEIKSSAKFKKTSKTVALFSIVFDKENILKYKRIVSGGYPKKLQKGERIFHFYVRPDQRSSWYNDQTYLDTMNYEAVKEFIKVTHKAYEKQLGKKLGKRVPGIFTDEPNYGSICFNEGDDTLFTTWTGKIPQVFKKRYGYDLLDRLPELFYDVSGQPVSQARYHYFDCITHLFVDAFAKQIGEWCEKTGMMHTGHVLAEDTLSSMTSVVGSCMRFYEYMQAPGMDLLTEHRRIYDTAKMVSSAARQFGRKWRLTETYGCSGWDFSFAGHKALGDWQAALGINLRCQHLSWYTMEGEAKRDYPAGIFYQSPWWEIYSKVEDYFARIHAVMTRGVEKRDLLVIHPNESMWLKVKKDWAVNKDKEKYDQMLIDLGNSLLKENVDFDYGDEEILSRYGNISIKDKVSVLNVGKARYKAVIVPPLVTMRSTTLTLLEKFSKAGGMVVFAGKVPEYVDALPSEEVVKFAATCRKGPEKGKALARIVAPVVQRVSITDSEGKEIPSTLYLLKEDTQNQYLFICNTGHKAGQISGNVVDSVLVRDRLTGYPEVYINGFGDCKGTPLELDPDTGEVFSATTVKKKDCLTIKTSFPPIGSRLFILPKKKTQTKYPVRKEYREISRKSINPTGWDIMFSEDNSLVLDRPRYKIGAGKWHAGEEILRVDYAVRDALGIARRGGQMVQPWARKVKRNPKKTEVKLAYSFHVKDIPCGALSLAMERPDTFSVTVNGNQLSSDSECGWWCDRSLRKIAIDPVFIKMGDNEIVLTCAYDETHPGLEIVYLLGDFGVKLRNLTGILTAPVRKLRVGDWVSQGLPFYSGAVTYCTKIRVDKNKSRTILHLPEFRGSAVRIWVNGESSGIIAWQPNELEITKQLKIGINELKIEVFSHRRNSHGPFHLTEKWPDWTGPTQYVTNGKEWQEKYQLVPCGLMKAPNLITKE